LKFEFVVFTRRHQTTTERVLRSTLVTRRKGLDFSPSTPVICLPRLASANGRTLTDGDGDGDGAGAAEGDGSGVAEGDGAAWGLMARARRAVRQPPRSTLRAVGPGEEAGAGDAASALGAGPGARPGEAEATGDGSGDGDGDGEGEATGDSSGDGDGEAEATGDDRGAGSAGAVLAATTTNRSAGVPAAVEGTAAGAEPEGGPAQARPNRRTTTPATTPAVNACQVEAGTRRAAPARPLAQGLTRLTKSWMVHAKEGLASSSSVPKLRSWEATSATCGWSGFSSG